MIDAKNELRERMRAVRDAIDSSEASRACVTAADHAFTAVVDHAPSMVAVYSAVRSELNTGALVDKLFAAGIAVAFPRVVRGKQRMGFHLVRELAELTPGYAGILEPPTHLPVVPVENIDLFIIPGIAFDAQGNRLGWGRGHYDVTLAENAHAVRVGFAFDTQVIDAVPSTSYDLPMDLVITEHRALQTGRGSRSET